MSTRYLFLLLFVIALFAIAVGETIDPDMWWHLRTGEYILEQGIPRHDIFSFTVPHHRWVTHEWLSQLFMWLIYSAAGLGGLIIVFTVLITLTFWLVYLACPGKPYLAAFVTLLAALASAITWGVRPQMFNLLLAALFVLIVERVRHGRCSPRWFWLFPPLTVLWVNLHSGYLLGVVLLTTYTVGEALENWFRRAPAGEPPTPAYPLLPSPAVRLLALVTPLSFLAALLNPNGYVLWYYPFETLGSAAMQGYIQEWQPSNFRLPLFWPFAALLLLGLGGWLAAVRRRPASPSFTDLLLFAGTAAAGLLSARNVPLFAVVSAPIVARALWNAFAPKLESQPDGPPAQTRPLLRLLNTALFLLALLAAGVWTASKLANNDAAIAARFPVAAVDYLEETGLASRPGYNSYGWGGYLIWRGLPVFVDGRADVYGDPFLFYYLQTLELQPAWREPLDDYGVAYVLLERHLPLSILLAESGEWEEVYADDLAQIFVRRSELLELGKD